jgi:hypothetical protein
MAFLPESSLQLSPRAIAPGSKVDPSDRRQINGLIPGKG